MCRLLNTSAPSKVVVERKPEMTDHDLWEAQQLQLRATVERSVAACVGRGAMTLFVFDSSDDLLIAEAVRVPALSLSGWMGKRSVSARIEILCSMPN